MMTNKRQRTGPHPDSRRQQSKNSDQKPTTSNRYDALADELVDDDIILHQPGTADEKTKRPQPITNRQGLLTRREQITSVCIRKPVVVCLLIPNVRLRTKNDVHQNTKYLARHYNLKRSIRCCTPPGFNMYKTNALLDTGAVHSAMTEAEHPKITTAHPNALLQEMPALVFEIQIANGKLVKVKKQVFTPFAVAERSFKDTLLVLPTMGMVPIGMSFLESYPVNTDVKNHLVHLPDIPMQVRRKSNVIT